MIQNLSQRNRDIFEILISDYIATADPVGSRTIAKKYLGRLSPATIRNVLLDLTELGLLSQPHTSAGRVPTVDGFKFYASSLLKRRELSDGDMEMIRERCSEDERNMGNILQKTSHILAAVSRYVGLVATPSIGRIVFKRIEFVPLSRHKLLGILVSRDGMVENRLIEIGDDLNFIELERIANYCNKVFIGLSLDEALNKITRELASEQAQYDELLKKAMLFSKEVIGSVADEDLVVDGEMQLLREPEFSELNRFQELVDALEEKNKVLHLLERCRDAEGVRIFIGSDAKISDENAMAVVSAPYYKDGKVIGTLGVIGPMRMDYARVVPIVDFTAKVLGDVLEAS